MLIALHIDYPTRWGQQLYVCPTLRPRTGGTLPPDAIPLATDGEGHWFATVALGQMAGEGYTYAVAWQRDVIDAECGPVGHSLVEARLMAEAGARGVAVWDAFDRQSPDQAYFARFFTDAVYHHPEEPSSLSLAPLDGPTLTVEVEAARIRPDHVVALTSDSPATGQWDPARAVRMHYRLAPGRRPVWTVTLPLGGLRFPLFYKFVTLDADDGHLVAWEERTDRYFEPGTVGPMTHLLVRDRYFVSSAHPWRGAGISVPADQLTLALIDWAVSSGLSVIDLTDLEPAPGVAAAGPLAPHPAAGRTGAPYADAPGRGHHDPAAAASLAAAPDGRPDGQSLGAGADGQPLVSPELQDYAHRLGIWLAGPVWAGLDILRLDPIEQYFDRLTDPFYNHAFEDLWVHLGRRRLSAVVDGRRHRLCCASTGPATSPHILRAMAELHIPRTEDLFSLHPLSFFADGAPSA